jgi:hypothetical protein
MRRPKLKLAGWLVAGVFAALAGAPITAGAVSGIPVGNSACEGEAPLCNPAQHFTVTTDGALGAELVADVGNCVAIAVRFAVDGGPETASASVPPGGSTGSTALGPVAPGTHTLSLAVDVPPGGINCDSISARSWSGTLWVTTSGVAAADAGLAHAGGDIVTVSTAVTGSPRPAGITATLTRGATAAGVARISVATYAGIPSVLVPTPPPIRAAAFLDLQLTNADAGDRIAGEFLPPNPIIPGSPPILPPNPIIPSGPPILPPNPIRLAWWDGSGWSPVLVRGGPPILPAYDSVLQSFSFDFSAVSSPSVFQLDGTVFAVIPNYYFRGFGAPVDAAALNVAKAGRAIPLKWQVFDENVDAVLDLDPRVVKLSSVAFACATASGATDALEEYAPGASGLEHLGDGVYQLNWKTSKDYAGSCRRLRLDLGERNPDGTTIYRTADFQFTR